MQSEEFQQLLKDRQNGERVRVLFDLLMETIRGSGLSTTGFWEGMKEAILKEEEAVKKMWSSPLGDEMNKSMRKRKVKEKSEQTQLKVEPDEKAGPLFDDGYDKEYGVNGDPNVEPPY